ncbi:hypothetical protein M569_01371, partial [Genlisea aurea]
SSSFFSILILSLLLISAVDSNGITLDLIHRDAKLTPRERISRAVSRSRARNSFLNSLISPSTTASFGSTVHANSGEYLMKIHLGTPPVEILAIADTGSDLTWTQCLPCDQCYQQQAPIFDPRRSQSYRTLPCSSPACDAAGSSSCGDRNQCNYQVNYGDQSYTIGDLAKDTLTFADGSGRRVGFPGFAFGCGHQNQGTFSGNGSGLFGLGRGEISIINQLSDSINGKFSYCLTLIDSSSPSKISFGTDATVSGNNTVTTPLARNNFQDTFYFLTLEGLSVGSRRFHHKTKPSDSSSASSEGNIIIDSGTTLTYLPQDLYDQLESALVETIVGKRVKDSQGVFGLCYAAPARNRFRAPPIVAHFRGADLVLDEISTFLEVEQGVICLTFVASGDVAIFGNLHQMNLHVGYDLVEKVVRFQPTDC